jgi:hypothetical protein
LVCKVFGLPIAKELAFMKVNFETPKLFKGTQKDFHILCSSDVMFHKKDHVIGVLYYAPGFGHPPLL